MTTELRWGDLVVVGDARRRELRAHHGNGVDAVEVREGGRRLLVFFLEHAPRGLQPGNIRIDPAPGASPVSVLGVRRPSESDPELEDRLIVELAHPGSAGAYRLRVVERRPDGTPGMRPLRGIDPRYAEASFVFDVDTPRPPIAGAPAGTPSADDAVSYLFRDYEGLRRLMLDRLAVTLPAWPEQHIPDLWITLVELLAYAGDDLSYYQDAVATEAYLRTARNRVSVRRHARLVDYRLHEGCHARAWVSVAVTEPMSLPLGRVRFATAGHQFSGPGPVLDAASMVPEQPAPLAQYTPLGAAPGAAGEPQVVELLPAHNTIELWSWGELDSHLDAGATSAVLADGAPATGDGQQRKRALALQPGDVIVLEETHDPSTLGTGPADPTHRQAVRLTAVRPLVDRLYGEPLLEVRWSEEDALTFDLALRAAGRSCAQASGNIILVAHGVAETHPVDPTSPGVTSGGLGFATPFPDPATVARHQARMLRSLYAEWRRDVLEWFAEAAEGEPLSEHRLELLARQVGADELERLGLARAGEGGDHAQRAARDEIALAEVLARGDRLLRARRERLERLAVIAEVSGPLIDVFLGEVQEDWGPELAAGLAPARPGAWGPAAAAIVQDPRVALPVLELTDDAGHTWTPALDLIGAQPSDRVFVAEVSDQGIAGLRLNAAGDAGSLTARYWIGNGSAGNAEIEAINAIVWLPMPGQAAGKSAPPAAVAGVRNPLPVTGGVDAETTTDAKLAIPGAFLERQPRALTVADYVALASAVPGVRAAAAQPRFTGSLRIVEVAIQPASGEDPSDALLARVRSVLDRARRVGQLVRVVAPRYRPLVVELQVTLAPSAVRSQLAAQLARLVSSGWLPDGTPALLHPSKLAFAGTLYSSPIVAAVHAIAGVQAVSVSRFGFLDQPAGTGAAAVSPALTVGALQLARLDNDPTDPGRGYARVTLVGGR